MIHLLWIIPAGIVVLVAYSILWTRRHNRELRRSSYMVVREFELDQEVLDMLVRIGEQKGEG